MCTGEEVKGKDPHTTYSLKCVMMGGGTGIGQPVMRGRDVMTWTVKRRYSEFAALNARFTCPLLLMLLGGNNNHSATRRQHPCLQPQQHHKADLHLALPLQRHTS